MTKHRAGSARSRAAVMCAAGVVVAGCVFGAGVALADDAPAPGTEDCALLIEADATVQAAIDAQAKAAAALNLLGADDDGFAAAQDLVATLGVKVDDARTAASLRLCDDATDDQPGDEQPPADDPTDEPGEQPPADEPGDDQPADPGGEQPVEDEPAAGSSDDDAPEVTDDVVVPTEDDGSLADVTGLQVRVVPQGSVDTGSAQ